MTYEVITSYPHDPSAFTQGLVYWEGYFYESTGLYGESSLRKVAIETGEVLQKTDLPQAYFGEGLTLWQDQLIQLTWREGTGFIYNLEYFTLIEDFTYPTEGWGLTHDGTHLIMSDGSPTLFYLDPETFQVVNRVNVFYQGQNISRINELEYIRGEIFANIWQTDDIIRINPHTGEVMGWIDLGGLLPNAERTPATDVLNGIAYDPENDRLFITGKRWPKVYEVRLLPIEPGE
jgi:glutamine cyclotransferase